MLKTIICACTGVVVLVCLGTMAGCMVSGATPTLGILSYPVPVTPLQQKSLEDKYWVHKRYDKAPVLGPITPNCPVIAMDEPSDDEVMRALESARGVQRGISMLWERSRNNVRITKDLIDDHVDPPRVYPLVGPAQLHHAKYKCTIYFVETTRVGWPFPHTLVNDDAQEVVYIDHDHLHMVGNVDSGPGSNLNK